jgi:hypothetical protein
MSDAGIGDFPICAPFSQAILRDVRRCHVHKRWAFRGGRRCSLVHRAKLRGDLREVGARSRLKELGHVRCACPDISAIGGAMRNAMTPAAFAAASSDIACAREWIDSFSVKPQRSSRERDSWRKYSAHRSALLLSASRASMPAAPGPIVLAAERPAEPTLERGASRTWSLPAASVHQMARVRPQ